MKINKKFITKNRYRLVKIQNNINNLFKIFGVDIRFDLTYHGSYLTGGESMFYRKEIETGKQDTEVLKDFVDKESVILDIGCGCGRIEKFLADYCKKIYGIDVSPTAVKIAKEFVNKTNAFFCVNNGNKLNMFEDNMFDLAFEIGTFHHISREDFYNYLLEIHRVLKNNGIFFFTFNDIINKLNFDYFAYNASLNNRTLVRMRFYTDKEIEFLLRKTGFKSIKIKTWKNRWEDDCVKKVIARVVKSK